MSVTFTTDQAKHILEQTALSFQHPEITEALGGPNAVKCWSCRIGLNTAAGATIAAAIAAIVASGGAAALPEVAAIAVITGLSETAVSGILTAIVAGGASGGAAAVEAVIEELCEAMGACG